MSTREVAWALGLSSGAVMKQLKAPVDRNVLQAVRLRLALEDLVGSKG